MHSNGKESTSSQWPNWVCKNNCGKQFAPDTNLARCPDCGAVLVRWLRYQEKIV